MKDCGKRPGLETLMIPTGEASNLFILVQGHQQPTSIEQSADRNTVILADRMTVHLVVQMA
jgi:hypothetical protein